MVKDLLLEEVCLIQQKGGMDLVGAEVFDMVGNGVENGGGGGLGIEAEREAELAVEVAATEGSVMTISQPKARFGQSLAYGSKDTGLADAGLTCQQDMAVLAASLHHGVDDALSR